MMLPAALPVFLLYRCCLYLDTRRTGKLLCFRAAYAIVWAGFGLLMILAQATGESGGLLDPMALALARRWGSAVLILAGFYQLTPYERIFQHH